jgi:hypothetical protein
MRRKVATFDMLRRQDFRLMLERMATMSQRKAKEKKSWQDKGTTACHETLEKMDWALDQAAWLNLQPWRPIEKN